MDTRLKKKRGIPDFVGIPREGLNADRRLVQNIAECAVARGAVAGHARGRCLGSAFVAFHGVGCLQGRHIEGV